MNEPNRSVNPAIAARLEAFAERRRRLIVRRGLYALVIALLVAMSLAAAVDRFALLEDAARYAISGLAWLAVFVVVWRACLRRLVHPPDRSEVARMIEGVRPELREDLLSAVELGYGVPDGGWDSPVFRDLLQQDVADRMQGIDVEALLPFSLNRLWSRLAFAVVAVCLILLAVPGLHFYRPFLRALIPGVNIQRVSRTQIEVTEPQPADTVVPRGDTVTVVAELTGAPADAAWLESIQSGKRARVAMKQVAAHRFSADLDIGDEEVRYRIRAGDAMTRKYRLTAVPPPRVVRFMMTYHYPSYLGWDPREVAGSDGNLEAPEGTRVELEFEVDQPVRHATLQLDVTERTQPIALESAGKQRLRTSLVLREAGTYRVDLVAKQTGFPNRFSPEYEIVVQPDRVPIVERVRPERERTVMPNEILDMEAVARDDFGLAELQQQIRVNRGPWTPGYLLNAGLATEQVAVHAWDLMALDVKPGDRLFTKYVAVDGKGLRGESEVLKLIVGSPGLSSGNERSLEARKQLARDLDILRESAERLRKVAEATGKSLRESEPDSTRNRQQQLQLAAAAERTRLRAEQAMDAVREALGKTDDRLDVDDFAMTGRALSRVTRELLEQGQRKLGDVARSGEPGPRAAAMGEAGKRLVRAASRTAEVARSFDALLAADESRHLQQVLEALHQEQMALPDEAQAAGEERARRKQEMVAAQAGEVESALEELREWGRSSRGEIDQVRNTLAQADEFPSDEDGFDTQMAGRMNDMLRQATERMRPVAHRLGQDAEKARKQLREMGGHAVADVQEARKALDSAKRSPEASRADTQSALDTAVDLLADRADWEERSADGLSPWARDLDRAASIMSDTPPASGDKQEMDEAVQRLRTLQDVLLDLEAGQAMADTRQATERLAQQERWEASDQADERALAWQRLDDVNEETERMVRQSDMPDSSTEQFSQALRGQDAQRVDREMNERRKHPQRTPQSQSDSLSHVAEALGSALTDARPAIQAARERLAELSPSLGEHLADLGEVAEALAADTAAEAPGPDAEEVNGLLERQEALTEQVNDARDLLRRDALAQDLNGRPGRERARDADDALAMLEGLPEAAEAHLRQAPEPSLSQAAEEQANLAGTLNELAQHYENLEQDLAGMTRPGLRSHEEPLDIFGELDAQYGELERLAAMLDQDPAQAMQTLEQELASRPDMQDELAAIAQDAIQQAADTIRQTAGRETGLAETVEALGQETGRRATQLQQRAEVLAERASTLQQERLPMLAARARDAGLEADAELRQARRAAGYLAEHFPRNMDPAHAADAATRAAASGERMQEAAGALESVTGRAQDTPVGTEAGSAATEAGAIAAEANDIAEALQQLANHEPPALAAMAGEQSGLTATTREAASDIGRAARHESRLGTERAQTLQQIGRSTQATADREMGTASEMMAAGSPAEQTAPLAADAGAALQARAEELAQMIGAYDSATTQAAAMSEPMDRAGQWMARALDRLDGGQNTTALPSELARAAGEQAAAMARSRTPMPGVSSESRQGAPVNAPAVAATLTLPAGARASTRAWANLPEHITRQLRDARREAVPEEYREMVDAYFKRIAQEGRK